MVEKIKKYRGNITPEEIAISIAAQLILVRAERH